MAKIPDIDDARSQLLRHALALLEENGHESLSIRRVSDRAGLSSGAPYYHFPDRRALLLGLAIEGFDKMDALARGVVERADFSPPEILERLANEFLDFGASHPQLMDLMYESELTRPIDPLLEPGYRRAFDLVVNVMHRIHSDSAPGVSLVRAVAFWTALFGLSRALRQQLLDPFDREIEGNWRDAILGQMLAAATAP